MLDRRCGAMADERVCQRCGASLAGAHGLRRYCSDRCRNLTNGNGGKAGSIVFCKNCNVPFVHPGTARFHCSPSCRVRYGEARKLERARRANIAKFGPIDCRECAFCGRGFSPRKSNHRFCSKACTSKAWRQSDQGREYFQRPEVRERLRAAAQRYLHSEHGKAAQRERDARSHNVARRKAYRFRLRALSNRLETIAAMKRLSQAMEDSDGGS